MICRKPNTPTLRFVIAAGLLLACSMNVATAQPIANERAKLIAANGEATARFGLSVSVSGNAVIIGASETPCNPFGLGAAYIFRFDGADWIQEAKLCASVASTSRLFGDAVSISGDYAIVGDLQGRRVPFNVNSETGLAYIFHFDGATWTQQARLLASDGQKRDFFGASVSISGGVAMVGSTGHVENGFSTGAAYVFRFDGANWQEEAKLLAADADALSSFGSSVSIDNNVAVIGDKADGDNGPLSGSAYIFRFDGAAWTQEAKLLASDGQAGDRLGTSVSISGNAAIAGALFDGDNGAFSGSAYIFSFDGNAWTQQPKLLASDGQAGDTFGDSVSINAGKVVVGAFQDDDNGGRSGSAYIFSFDGMTWSQSVKLLTSDGQELDQFGDSVSISGDVVISGAQFNDNENGNRAGAAYIFTGISDCNNNGTLDIADIANGTSLDCQPNGVPDECDVNPTDPDGNGLVSPDCNTNNIPDECEGGCNDNSVPDECDVDPSDPDGDGIVSSDCDLDGTPDECQTDCNVNLVPDVCEVLGPVTLFATDFEAGLPMGWTGDGLWHVTNLCPVPTACDPLQWAYFGQDASCNFDTGAQATGVLTAAPFSLHPSLPNVTLLYCSAYNGDGGQATTGLDAAWLTANGQIIDDVGFTTMQPGQWESRIVDLTAFIGQTVTLAWHFDSINAISNATLGWQVDQVSVVAVIDNDCNANGIPDECDISSGTSQDCQPNGIPDECEGDCNGNGISDDCDISSGTSQDCNANGVPDECETDCNNDGVPDDCQSFIDCNFNGIPDVCEGEVVCNTIGTAPVGVGPPPG